MSLKVDVATCTTKGQKRKFQGTSKPEYLRPNQVAQTLGISKSTLYAWLQSGQLSVRPVRLGERATAFRRVELESWLESRERTTPLSA